MRLGRLPRQAREPTRMMVSLDLIRDARERIGDAVISTPCTVSESLSAASGCRLSFKLECLQHTGSFKVRGALNRLLAAPPPRDSDGVLAFSAGNHAQGVAWAASRVGAPARIVMPRTTPLVKVTRTRALGARVERCGDTFAEAAERAAALRSSGQLEFIHPFDDPLIVAGQGTVGLEILEQRPEVEAIVCPIGGGGLIAGIATAVKAVRPDVLVLGVQTATAPSMRESVAAARVISRETGPTIADGIAVKKPSDLTLEIVGRLVDDIVLVSETEVEEALFDLLANARILTEGAGAAPYAALRAGRLPRLMNRQAVVVLSGGNIDLNILHRIIERAEVREGRLVRLSVSVGDRPGALAGILHIVGEREANVLHIQHERSFSRRDLLQVEIELVLETRDRDHVDEIINALQAAGYGEVADLGPRPL